MNLTINELEESYRSEIDRSSRSKFQFFDASSAYSEYQDGPARAIRVWRKEPGDHHVFIVKDLTKSGEFQADSVGAKSINSRFLAGLIGCRLSTVVLKALMLLALSGSGLLLIAGSIFLFPVALSFVGLSFTWYVIVDTRKALRRYDKQVG